MSNAYQNFIKHVPAIGTFTLRPVQISRDIALIHDWVNREYASYWGLLGQSMEQVETEYKKISGQAEVFLGYCNSKPAFLLECYDPRQSEVSRHYMWRAGDRGMHMLVAPAERRIARFTWSVFTVIMDFIFSDPAAQRIVVEPDVRNNWPSAICRRIYGPG